MKTRFYIAMLTLIFSLLPWQSMAQSDTWTPNFRESDIVEVIRAVQDVTGKTMILDPRVRGQITVISSTPVDADTYYSIFLRAMDLSGFAAVETAGNMVSILPAQEARAAPLPFSTGNNIADQNRYVTEAFQLDNVSVNQVLPVLRPLVSQSNGQMSAHPNGNMIVIVDTLANVERIRQILERIDQTAIPETEAVRLQFANAAEMVVLLRQMHENPQTTDQEPITSRLQINADPRTNAILITGGQRQRDNIRNLVRMLDQPREQTGNTRVVYLEYASATRVAEVLTSVIRNTYGVSAAPEGGQARRASVEADPDNNAIIITAELDLVEELMDVVQRLDIQRAQVLVEAIIVEINDDVGQNLGIQWLFRDDSGAFASSFDTGNNLQQLGQIVGGALNEDRQQALTGLAAGLAGVAGQTIGLGRLGGSTDLLALIDLLQASSGANILSTPNILTTDNTEAVITVGESVPFITGSYTNTGNTGSIDNPFQTINRQNVGTTLKVTPHVNRGDKVALDISQEISSISQRAGAVDLITNERKIQTRVTVADGETVVLGGLIRDNVIQSETRVPLLGSVPGVGRLFRSTSSSVQKTNLLVFIRPTILRDDDSLRGATAEKYQYIRDQQLRQLPINGSLFGGSEMPLLPPWETMTPAVPELPQESQP
jgi:general secretion pathway protein D